MSDTPQKMLQSIYSRWPELVSLPYAVKRVESVVPANDLAGIDPSTGDKWLFTFTHREEGEVPFEIKVTIGADGEIYKFITSK